MLTIVALFLGVLFTGFWTVVGLQESRATRSREDAILFAICCTVTFVQLAALANLCVG